MADPFRDASVAQLVKIEDLEEQNAALLLKIEELERGMALLRERLARAEDGMPKNGDAVVRRIQEDDAELRRDNAQLRAENDDLRTRVRRAGPYATASWQWLARWFRDR